jgi:GNAT superfamily N-acetyltransferase
MPLQRPKWSFPRCFRRGNSGLERDSFAMQEHSIHRACLEEIESAFALVTEYYEEVGVELREDRAQFEEQYFAGEAGVWLAFLHGQAVGCVALRKLCGLPNCAEIKRMYMRGAYRGRGVADSLLAALEEYALNCGYEWLYLDTTDSMCAAARFYKRKLYEGCERYNDNPQATIFMRKRLGAGSPKESETGPSVAKADWELKNNVGAKAPTPR